MKKHDFVVFGNCATVQLLKFKNMPHVGQTETAIGPFGDEIQYGGCTFNVFYAMAKLGTDIYPALTYADIRFKDKIYGICNELGLPTDGITGPKNECYTTCLMLEDENQEHITMMYRFGKDSDKDNVPLYDMEIKDEYFQNAKMVLMVMGNPNTGYEIVDKIEKHNVPLAFSYRNDPNLLPKSLLDRILPNSEVIFTNEVEAEYLCDIYKLNQMTDWFKLGKAKVIITTLGPRGSRVYSKNDDGTYETIEVCVTKPECDKFYAVGAGDAYVAGFMYGYSKKLPLKTCAQYGSTLSSFVLEKEGSTTNLPTLEQLLERNSRREDA